MEVEEDGLSPEECYRQGIDLASWGEEQRRLVNAHGRAEEWTEDKAARTNNDAMAVVWFRRAAERGHPGGQFKLGRAYDGGFGVVQDYGMARHWYTKSAEQGDTRATGNLGAMYANGEGVPIDLEKACVWYQRAAELGHQGALVNLASTRLNRNQDVERSVEVIREAADRGDVHWQAALAYRYFNGWSVPRDWSQAAAWALRAAENGSLEAQCLLGEMYLHGRGVPKDEHQAVFWLERAARRQHGEAQYLLAMVHLEANSVLRDDDVVREMIAEAAEQGHAFAMFVLGTLYHAGECGLPRDHEQARRWYKRALTSPYQGYRFGWAKRLLICLAILAMWTPWWVRPLCLAVSLLGVVYFSIRLFQFYL